MALMSYSKSLNGFVATGATILSGKGERIGRQFGTWLTLANTGDDGVMVAEDTDGGETTATEDTSEDEFTIVEYTSTDDCLAAEETSDSESSVEDEIDESVSAAEGTGKSKAPRPRKPLQLRSLDSEERFLKYLEPLLLSAKEDRCEEHAVELIKVLWSDRFPDSEPALRWRPNESLDSHPGWWALYFKERMRDIGLYSMFHRRQHTQVQDWAVKLSLEHDRDVRRKEYFAWADWGQYLTGHQYDVVISAETRSLTEISPEEFEQRCLDRILEAVRGSAKAA
ncbi:hypothetical protein H0H93_005326 [Arthromyces matolae]|nr:hypothetical protein H0H93_005326 [Arthromyces matolae]